MRHAPSSTSYPPSATFEGLEDRRLLSGGPFPGMLMPISAELLGLQMAIDKSAASHTISASTRDTSPASMPSLVGDWRAR